jgi:hypothetical protein
MQFFISFDCVSDRACQFDTLKKTGRVVCMSDIEACETHNQHHRGVALA